MLGHHKDEEKIRKLLIKKIVGCLLPEIILANFGECGFSGYDVVVFLHRELGVSLSSSTIYGSLYSLERKGLLIGYNESKKRVFKVTELGNLTVQAITSKIQAGRFVTVILTPAKNLGNQSLSHETYSHKII